jgi:hypothetical protein
MDRSILNETADGRTFEVAVRIPVNGERFLFRRSADPAYTVLTAGNGHFVTPHPVIVREVENPCN